MTGALTLRSNHPGTAAERSRAMLAGEVLLAAALVALAVVPDEAYLRSKVMWGQGLLLAASGALLLAQAWRRRLVVAAPGWLLAALLPALLAGLWVALGTPLSGTLARDEIERLLLLPLAAWATSSAAEHLGARRALLAVLVLSAVPVAAGAVAQNLAGILDLPINRVSRPASTFGNPVFLGAYLVLVTPLALAGAVLGRGLLRWGGALAAGLALPALFATQTRWAWLGFAAAVAFGAVLLAPTRQSRRRLLLGLLAAGLLLAVLNRDVVQRQHAHGLIWRDTTALIAEHPLGTGPGQFPVAFLPYASDELLAVYPRREKIINDAHSEPLQIVAELGWPGLLVAAWFVLQLARVARAAVRGADEADRPYVVALVAGLLGLCVMACGSPDQRFIASTMLFGALAGLLSAWATGWQAALGAAGRVALAGAGVLLLVTAVVRTRDTLALRDLMLSPPSFSTTATTADIPRLQAAVAANPGDTAAHYDLGVALARERRWPEAADSVEAAYVLSAGMPEVQRTLGLMQGMAGRIDAAVPNLQAALAHRGDDPEARYLLAYLHFCKGDLRSALTEVEALLAQHPDHTLARLLLQKLRE